MSRTGCKEPSGGDITSRLFSMLFRNSGTSRCCCRLNKLMLTVGRSKDGRVRSSRSGGILWFTSLSAAQMICDPGARSYRLSSLFFAAAS